MDMMEGAQLASDEGRVNHIYLCTNKHPTAGVGHKLSVEEQKTWANNKTIPDALIDAWFKSDLETARGSAQRYNYPAQVEDILTNMIFQMGAAGVANFKKMHEAITKRDYATASKEMLDSKWAKSDSPGRAARLAARMAAM